MRDYNQIVNLGKLSNQNNNNHSRGSSKRGRPTSSTTSSSQSQPQPPRPYPDDEEEKKADDHAVPSSSSATAASSYTSTAPSTPSTTATAHEATAASQPHSPPRTSTMTTSTANLSPTDALSMRREGAEATIARLRQALDETTSSESQTKSALAKSEAVVLELKSTVRQMKRQMEHASEKQAPTDSSTTTGSTAPHNQNSTNQDQRLGELQLQLDRAHAQMVTADMVRKELEDTLEAEQYTWELRVQDQERQIAELTTDCASLVNDLEKARTQHESEQDAWLVQAQELNQQIAKLQQKQDAIEERQYGNNSNNTESATQDLVLADLEDKIQQLERERTELQGCLDEALKELEAVDAELQQQQEQQSPNDHDNNSDLVEPLQHLYRWLLERDGQADSYNHGILTTTTNQNGRPSQEAKAILSAIQDHLRQHEPVTATNATAALVSMDERKRLQALEAECSVLKGDLQARQESSDELRSSLKEAVALLKPLQDAVAQGDRDKARLQQQVQSFETVQQELQTKQDECDNYQQQVERLQLELTQAKAVTASSLVQTVRQQQLHGGRDSPVDALPGESKARARLRAKRQEEEQIKQMLDSARNRFRSLQQQNMDLTGANTELQAQLDTPKALQSAVQDELQTLQQELTTTKRELAQKEQELESLESDLATAQANIRQLEEQQEQASSTFHNHTQLEQAKQRVEDLETKLGETNHELQLKQTVEKALNKSLKEALNLLRPLQRHLEDAEQEKRALATELESLKKRLVTSSTQPNNTTALTTMALSDHDSQNDQKVKELEYAVTQLEQENSQLHDALDDMSHSLNNASHVSASTATQHNHNHKLKEELVELQSRYEVTQSRLQDAIVENHALRNTVPSIMASASSFVSSSSQGVGTTGPPLTSNNHTTTSRMIRNRRTDDRPAATTSWQTTTSTNPTTTNPNTGSKRRNRLSY